ncbi:MAG: hypothetical protein LBM60_07975 [Clostridium sp.]|nr:hypothetical protein [Clostridium sp.]
MHILAKKRKLFIKLLIIALVLILFVLSPPFAYIRSLVVMGVYSAMHEKESLMQEEDINLQIPGGLTTAQTDWYPFVMTFVANEAYARAVGEPDAKLTILYNFPAFSLLHGSSRLYDTDSPYYSSFYGAYLVRDKTTQQLAQGIVDPKRVARIAEFDFFTLVLRDFGLEREDEVFSFEITEQESDVSYLGMDGWTRLSADILVNGCAHHKRKGVTSYLQYGAPPTLRATEEFAPIQIHGIVYARYFEQWDVGVYFYVMGEEEVAKACDQQILSQSTLY